MRSRTPEPRNQAPDPQTTRRNREILWPNPWADATTARCPGAVWNFSKISKPTGSDSVSGFSLQIWESSINTRKRACVPTYICINVLPSTQGAYANEPGPMRTHAHRPLCQCIDIRPQSLACRDQGTERLLRPSAQQVSIWAVSRRNTVKVVLNAALS